MTNGWDLDKRTHFDEFVLHYDKIRPDYPNILFSDILAYAGGDKIKKSLEIGAGTGKATHPFLDAGYDMTAVEISPNMADFLLNKFKSYKNFNVIVAAFEDAVLEENSYGLITAATSFHWVNPEIGCPKAFRLLRSGGTFALFRYNIFPSIGEEIQTVYEKHYHSHYHSTQRTVNQSHDAHRQPAEILYRFGFSDLSVYGFCDVTMKLYDVQQLYTADEYIDFLETLSDHRHLPEDNKAALYAGIKEAIQKHGGYHKVDYVFQLYMGRKL